jgi:anthranilate synthase/aminodeoxychorismate synthase-like glutamine amidotransferase
VPRGPYTGSAGYLHLCGDAHWNILIRTVVIQDGLARVHAGSGIVADSVPAREWREAGAKAQALLEAATGQSQPSGNATRLGEVTLHGAWRPPVASRRQHARILLVDNYDSFVHNLADYCAAAGAEVLVVRNDADLEAALAAHQATHVILGPGPGWPKDSGITLQAARGLVGRLPMLGVCLGHQALAQAHGGAVHIGPAVHGKTSPIHHNGDALLAHLADPFAATRYHSLHVTPPPGWNVTAWLADGTVMAMRHPQHPVWGLQFHPESFCTEGGLEIVQRFLEA